MGREHILIMMAQFMKDNGKRTSSMALERKYGLMEPILKDNIKMGKNWGLEHFSGQMALHMRESLDKIV